MTRTAVAAVLLAALAGCTMNLREIEGPRTAAIPTAWPWNSTIYAARTDAGVVVIDLGWHGAEDALEDGLREIGAEVDDVRHVFLTHSHRDHIGAWMAVRHARFHVAAPEAALLTGAARHPDPLSALADRTVGGATPLPGEVRVETFARDTAFVLGGDTVRAFVVPGHTPGSAAYLRRGVLFVGDAVARPWVGGFRAGPRLFSTDPALNRESLRALFDRALPHGVDWVCTAHGKCARPDARFLRKVLR